MKLLFTSALIFIFSILRAQTWSTLGNGIDGGTDTYVNAITSFNGNIIASGSFTSASGTSANNIAMWNGSSWQAMGAGLDGEVLVLAVYKNELYAGGTFTSPTNYIAKWDGSSWVTVGGGGPSARNFSRVSALLVDTVKNLLYVGGDFNCDGSNNLASWDGSAWKKMATTAAGFKPGNLNSSNVTCLAIFDGDLYAGGNFEGIDGDTTKKYIGKWNGTKWDSLARPRFVQPPTSMTTVDKCGDPYYLRYLYVGGYFDGPASRGITRYDSTKWIAVDGGVQGKNVNTVMFYHNEVYAGGGFNSANVGPFDRITRWNDNDSLWKELNDGSGNGLGHDEVKGLAVIGTKLYVGGSFDSLTLNGVNKKEFHHIAIWETPEISGCTEKLALNYNAAANVDDCSCILTCTAHPSFTVQDTVACTDDTLFFTNTSQGATGYEWQIDGVTASASTNFNYSSSTTGTHTVSLIAKNNLCQDTMNQIVNIVNSSVTPTISIFPMDTVKICQWETVSFHATSSGGGSNPTYQWNFVIGGPVGTDSVDYNTYSMPSTDEIYCMMISNANCASPDTVFSDTTVIEVSTLSASPTIFISPNDTVICPGQSVKFTATISNGGIIPTYQWYLDGNKVSINPTYTTPILNNTATVYCELTSSSSCASPNMVSSSTTTITVLGSNVTPSVTISPASASICSGEPQCFTASPTNGGSSPSYQWFLDLSPVGVNSSTYCTPPLSSNATVFVRMTSNAACAIPNNVPSSVSTITVSGSGNPSVSITPGSVTACDGDSITFTATSQFGGNAPFYQWYVDGTPVGTNSLTFKTAFSADATVWVVMTSNSSCATPPLTVTSNIAFISVSGSVVVPSVTISPNDTIICSGQTVCFTAFPTNGGSTPTYQWFLNGSSVGSGANYCTSALSSNATVYCIMTSSISCASPTSATSLTTNITVNASVAPTISIAPSGTDSICSGDSVSFTATATNVGSSPIYKWYLNGNPVGGNNVSYTTPALISNATVYCIIKSNAGCAIPDSAISVTTTIIVTSTLAASVSILPTSSTICFGETVSFTATGINGGTNPVYQWKLDGVNVGINSNIYTTPSLNDTATVLVTFTSDYSCASPATSNSNSVKINVIPPVVVTIQPAFDTTVSSGTPVQLNACCGTTYTWTPTTGLSCNSCQNPIATPDETTTYTVMVDSLGCTNSDTVRVIIENELFIPNSFSPSGIANVKIFKLYGSGIKEIDFRVYNRLGEVVWKATTTAEAFNKGWDGTFNGDEQPVGIYTWTMKATFSDGSDATFNGKKTGTVLLVR